MSTGNKHDSGAAQGARRATEQAPESSPAGGGRRFRSLLSRPSGSLRGPRIVFVACGHGTSPSSDSPNPLSTKIPGRPNEWFRFCEQRD